MNTKNQLTDGQDNNEGMPIGRMGNHTGRHSQPEPLMTKEQYDKILVNIPDYLSKLKSAAAAAGVALVLILPNFAKSESIDSMLTKAGAKGIEYRPAFPNQNGGLDRVPYFLLDKTKNSNLKYNFVGVAANSISQGAKDSLTQRLNAVNRTQGSYVALLDTTTGTPVNNDSILTHFGIKEAPTGSEDKNVNTRLQNTKINISPNPINSASQATFRYNIKENANVNLGVYDLSGKLVQQLYNGNQMKGEHNASFRPGMKNISAGVYVVRMTVDGKDALSKKIIYTN
jgi:hypothetical protein